MAAWQVVIACTVAKLEFFCFFLFFFYACIMYKLANN